MGLAFVRAPAVAPEQLKPNPDVQETALMPMVPTLHCIARQRAHVYRTESIMKTVSTRFGATAEPPVSSGVAASRTAAAESIPNAVDERPFWLQHVVRIRLSKLDLGAIAVGIVAALALLSALAQTCQESVHKGEQLRAGQRQMAQQAAGDVATPTAAVSAAGITGL